MLLFLFLPIYSQETEPPQSSGRFYNKRFASARMGSAFHFSGMARYLAFAVGEGDDVDNLSAFISAIGLASGSIRKTSGNIIAGIAAKRACRNYGRQFDTLEHFSWAFYIGGVSSLSIGIGTSIALSNSRRKMHSRRASVGALITGIAACEILTTIHIINARRITSVLRTAPDNSDQSISLGLSPLITQKGAGLALSFGF